MGLVIAIAGFWLGLVFLRTILVRGIVFSGSKKQPFSGYPSKHFERTFLFVHFTTILFIAGSIILTAKFLS